MPLGLRPMILIITAIVILIIPGVIYNNANAVGLAPSSVTQVCDQQTDQCYSTTPVGCQYDPSGCTFAVSQTFSLLSIGSPFTSLLTGNILGFFSTIIQGQSYSATITSLVPQIPFTNSTVVTGTSGHNSGPANKGDAYCFAAPTGQTYITNPISPYIYNCEILGNGWLGNAWWGISCSPVGPSGGCGFINTVKDPFGGTPGNSANWLINDTAIWPASSGAGIFCPPNQASTKGYIVFGVTPLGSVPFNATYTYKFGLVDLGCTTTGASSTNPLNFLSVLGFSVGVVILIILSLGMSFETGALTFNFGLSSNSQGTRFAQVILIGLVVWIPLYSEFSPWFTSGLLPLGLDGAAGIMSILLTAMMFFGVFWQAIAIAD